MVSKSPRKKQGTIPTPKKEETVQAKQNIEKEKLPRKSIESTVDKIEKKKPTKTSK